MRHINKRRLTAGLSPAELNQLVAWFAQSYDAGWRPQIWSPDRAGELRAKIDVLEEVQRVADGDVPWV